MPEAIMKNPSIVEDAIKKISEHKFEDDVTMIYLKNIE
jgi:hypothetical protein